MDLRRKADYAAEDPQNERPYRPRPHFEARVATPLESWMEKSWARSLGQSTREIDGRKTGNTEIGRKGGGKFFIKYCFNGQARCLVLLQSPAKTGQ